MKKQMFSIERLYECFFFFANDSFGICQVLAQLFWISVSVLESDYEYEFLLAMRLLDKVLSRLPLDRPDCRDKVGIHCCSVFGSGR